MPKTRQRSLNINTDDKVLQRVMESAISPRTPNTMASEVDIWGAPLLESPTGSKSPSQMSDTEKRRRSTSFGEVTEIKFCACEEEVDASTPSTTATINQEDYQDEIMTPLWLDKQSTISSGINDVEFTLVADMEEDAECTARESLERLLASVELRHIRRAATANVSGNMVLGPVPTPSRSPLWKRRQGPPSPLAVS